MFSRLKFCLFGAPAEESEENPGRLEARRLPRSISTSSEPKNWTLRFLLDRHGLHFGVVLYAKQTVVTSRGQANPYVRYDYFYGHDSAGMYFVPPVSLINDYDKVSGSDMAIEFNNFLKFDSKKEEGCIFSRKEGREKVDENRADQTIKILSRPSQYFNNSAIKFNYENVFLMNHRVVKEISENFDKLFENERWEELTKGKSSFIRFKDTVEAAYKLNKKKNSASIEHHLKHLLGLLKRAGSENNSDSGLAVGKKMIEKWFKDYNSDFEEEYIQRYSDKIENAVSRLVSALDKILHQYYSMRNQVSIYEISNNFLKDFYLTVLSLKGLIIQNQATKLGCALKNVDSNKHCVKAEYEIEITESQARKFHEEVMKLKRFPPAYNCLGGSADKNTVNCFTAFEKPLNKIGTSLEEVFPKNVLSWLISSCIVNVGSMALYREHPGEVPSLWEDCRLLYKTMDLFTEFQCGCLRENPVSQFSKSKTQNRPNS